MITREIGDILDSRAEARGTCHRAVRARQASFRDLIPSFMIEIAEKKFFDTGCIELAPHLFRSFPDNVFRGLFLGGLRRRTWHILHEILSTFCPNFDKKVLFLIVHYFCESEVVPVVNFRTGLHRNTEACPARMTAVKSDNEHMVPSKFIVRIDVRTSSEYLVMNLQRMELTGADSYERELFVGVGICFLFLAVIRQR